MTLFCDTEGLRLDVFLSGQVPELTRSAAQRLVEQGEVLVDGKTVKKNYKTRKGDEISLTIPEPQQVELIPEDIPLDVRYEDGDVIVINKPKGLVVHPAPGHWTGTLVNALMYHCRDSLSGINGELRPGIVHRIDMDTSGLLIVAKNDRAHMGLAEQLKDHTLCRVYEAVVVGNIRQDSGTIDAPIGRHPVDRKKMTVTRQGGREAVTHFEVIRRYQGYTHVRLRLETGRTHQIRVHMSWQNHPIVGDAVYGRGKELGLDSQCLHARTLQFIHPVTGEKIAVDCPLPDYFEAVLKKLGPPVA
ncbi:MAG: RluA family pseudouridine synthase [Oscillospiraceae bacterium]|nr:RluA family pseudouridine synthase [Oscillospiraceae bacterium]